MRTKAIKDKRTIYIYSNQIQLLDTYESANLASQRTQIPKSTLLYYLDRKDINQETKLIKRIRLHSKKYNQEVVISSVELTCKK